MKMNNITLKSLRLGNNSKKLLFVGGIKSSLNSGNTCYYPAGIFCLLAYCPKIKITYVKLSFFLLLFMAAKHILTESENRVLRRMYGHKRKEIIGS
jgi:hypothetical protein